MKPFLENPVRDYSVREFASAARVSPATASAKLKRLAKEGILIYRKERNLDLYKADVESDAFKDLKAYYNVRKIRESGLMEALSEFYLKPTIVLFGSMSYGTDTTKSDMDLLILTAKKDPFQRKEEFERKLGREIQIFAVGELKELKNTHLVRNAIKGTVLQGELDLEDVDIK